MSVSRILGLAMVAMLLAACPPASQARPQDAANSIQPPPPPPVGSLPRLEQGFSHAPRYPGIAIYSAEEGMTMLMVLIEPDGHPADVKVDHSSGYRQLDKAAIDAARTWQFQVNGGNTPGSAWYARVPVNFNNDATHDRPGFWGRAYAHPHYVQASEPFPYPSVAAAFDAVSEKFGDKHLSSYRTFPDAEKANAPEDLWVFLDMDTGKPIAIHFKRGGSIPAPTVELSVLCSDGAVACERRMPTLLRGPAFARGDLD